MQELKEILQEINSSSDLSVVGYTDPSCIHRPKAITAGITVGVISAVVVPLVLAYATALSALAIIGITVASVLIVGGIAYGVAYKVSEHSLNSKLSEVSCSNAQQTTAPNSPQ